MQMNWINKISYQYGFTLVEALVTVLVLAVGIIGLAGLQAVSLKMNQSSYLRIQAASLAYSIIDAMRANSEFVLNYDTTELKTPTCNPSQTFTWDGSNGQAIATSDLAIWSNQVACLIPSGQYWITITNNAGSSNKKVTVAITWNEAKIEGKDAANKDITQTFTIEAAL